MFLLSLGSQFFGSLVYHTTVCVFLFPQNWKQLRWGFGYGYAPGYPSWPWFLPMLQWALRFRIYWISSLQNLGHRISQGEIDRSPRPLRSFRCGERGMLCNPWGPSNNSEFSCIFQERDLAGGIWFGQPKGIDFPTWPDEHGVFVEPTWTGNHQNFECTVPFEVPKASMGEWGTCVLSRRQCFIREFMERL